MAGARRLSPGRLRAVAAVTVGDGGAGWDGARRQVGEGPRAPPTVVCKPRSVRWGQRRLWDAVVRFPSRTRFARAGGSDLRSVRRLTASWCRFCQRRGAGWGGTDGADWDAAGNLGGLRIRTGGCASLSCRAGLFIFYFLSLKLYVGNQKALCWREVAVLF